MIVSMGDKDGMYRRHSPEPILRQTKDFLSGTEEDRDIEDDLRWESYYRHGCSPATHLEKERMRVLIRDIPKMDCLKCGSKEVKIIFKQGNIHPMSGDAYYDVEVKCQICGEYSSFSYAEN